jgi:hypothetical protein
MSWTCWSWAAAASSGRAAVQHRSDPRTEKSVLFVVAWGRHWIIGTTDTDWSLAKAHPAASSRDIDYLLKHVNSVLHSPLTREDVEGVDELRHRQVSYDPRERRRTAGRMAWSWLRPGRRRIRWNAWPAPGCTQAVSMRP